jgi:hypothetical protein
MIYLAFVTLLTIMKLRFFPAGSSCCQHPQKHPDVTESLQILEGKGGPRIGKLALFGVTLWLFNIAMGNHHF